MDATIEKCQTKTRKTNVRRELDVVFAARDAEKCPVRPRRRLVRLRGTVMKTPIPGFLDPRHARFALPRDVITILRAYECFYALELKSKMLVSWRQLRANVIRRCCFAHVGRRRLLKVAVG